MNENALRSSIQTERPASVDDAELVMQAVLAEIAEDALRAPELYLRDTIVPAGGE